MTLAELKNLLTTTNFPVAYNAFPAEEDITPPFITYSEAYTNNFGSDDTVYKKYRHVQIDLWTETKDEAAEDTLETILSGIGFWDSTETFEDNQYIYRKTYDLEL